MFAFIRSHGPGAIACITYLTLNLLAASGLSLVFIGHRFWPMPPPVVSALLHGAALASTVALLWWRQPRTRWRVPHSLQEPKSSNLASWGYMLSFLFLPISLKFGMAGFPWLTKLASLVLLLMNFSDWRHTVKAQKAFEVASAVPLQAPTNPRRRRKKRK